MPRENQKKEENFSALLEKEVPELVEKGKQGDLSGALEGLYLLEKQTRQGGDFTTCGKIAREIVRVCPFF